MRALRLISSSAAAVALVTGLAGCSSSASKAAQPVAQSAATTAPTGAPSSTPAASSTPVSTPAPSSTPASASTTDTAGGGQTIAALLASFGPGPITGKHMPTADPAWAARVQQNKTPALQGGNSTAILNLMALVDEAAREKDTASLARLCADVCDPKTQAPLWQKPGTLDLISALIEQGPFDGEGAVVPDFMFTPSAMSFTSAPDSVFGKAVGVDSPAAYFKKYQYMTAFQNGSGGLGLQVEWRGIEAVSPVSR